jgi:hypothetical protein
LSLHARALLDVLDEHQCIATSSSLLARQISFRKQYRSSSSCSIWIPYKKTDYINYGAQFQDRLSDIVSTMDSQKMNRRV